MPDAPELSYFHVASAALLILVNAAVSLALRLRLTGTLLLASARAVTQLLLIGWILQWIFAQTHPLVIAATATFMTLIAGVTARGRVSRRYRWLGLDTCLAMWFSAWCVAVYGLVVVFQRPGLWFDPQYAIPLLGMILGNALNGISLGLETMLSGLAQNRGQIEMRLCHGASRWEATLPERQAAVRAGMMPIVNSMMIVGLVSLPGMMTGQLLVGTSPMKAVKYQLAILFLIASATAIGTVVATTLAFLRVVNRRHQFDFAALRQVGR